eukprot:9001119-Karenia_brevis.AAC.1
MGGTEEMPDISSSPINSPPELEGPPGPVSGDQSFEVLVSGGVGGGLAPQGPQYPVNMVAEQVQSRMRSDEEIAKIVSMVVEGLLPQLQKPKSKEKKEVREERSKVVLDEKYFRRMDKYSGDVS